MGEVFAATLSDAHAIIIPHAICCEIKTYLPISMYLVAWAAVCPRINRKYCPKLSAWSGVAAITKRFLHPLNDFRPAVWF